MINKVFNYKPPLVPYLSIIYQDKNLIVVDKPSGILSVPGRLKKHHDSIYSRVLKLCKEAYVVHRLDMATSGVILFARSKFMERYLMSKFRDRLINKTYYAVVSGKLLKKSGIIDLPISCDWVNRPKQKIDYDNGKYSLTEYTVISYLKNNTLLKLKPITGRTHQLRVHMQAIGYPIIGDDFYGNKCSSFKFSFRESQRLMLHSSIVCLNNTFLKQKFFSENFLTKKV